MQKWKKTLAIIMTGMLVAFSGCVGKGTDSTEQVQNDTTTESAVTEDTTTVTEPTETETDSKTDPAEPKTDDATGSDAEAKGIYILFTSDVHCGIDEGFGYAGLAQVKSELEKKGYEIILVDDGDAIQGEAVGTLSDGEAIVDLMNEVGYDVAIPGNHEFDYGMETFLNLAKSADYTYISCNFNRDGELVFKPYIIKEVMGIKIAFVGVTTPETLVGSSPKNFQNEKGEYIYGFMQDKSGEMLYNAVQEAVDAARDEGADLVYAVAHLGNEASCEPWTYADVIENTNGIDVFLDGHSHDLDQVVMKNKDGKEIVREAVGTKLNAIGYSSISPEGEILETSKWIWTNDTSVPELLGIKNDIGDRVDEINEQLADKLEKVVASTPVDLTIYDPSEDIDPTKPVRLIRIAETNLGDLAADAYRDQTGADVAIVNGGSVRANIDKGDITYEEIINIHPFGNMISVVEVTGQQILDALEWGSRDVPEENGGFLQVSGLTYEINAAVDSPCIEDEDSAFVKIEGERRVSNVKIGDEPLDPDKKYSLAANDYLLFSYGDGYTMFKDVTVLQKGVKLDNQVLIDYMVDTLGGQIPDEYRDPYGQGRITITE